MSYTFSAIILNKKEVTRNISNLIWEIIDTYPKPYKKKLAGSIFIEQKIKKDLYCIFYIPKSKSETDAYFKAISLFYENELISDLKEILSGKEKLYVWVYTDISLNEQGCVITRNFEEFRMIDNGEIGVNYNSNRKKNPTIQEDISVDPEDFGLEDDDESNFDEKAYHNTVFEKQDKFSIGNLIYKNLNITEENIIKVLYQLDI